MVQYPPKRGYRGRCGAGETDPSNLIRLIPASGSFAEGAVSRPPGRPAIVPQHAPPLRPATTGRCPMNAVPSSLAEQAGKLSADVTRPIPGSRKIHVTGSRPDIRVPMREIALDPTPAMFGGGDNPPLTLYDTSGPYTDPDAVIDLTRGLPPLRAGWIRERAGAPGANVTQMHYARRGIVTPEMEFVAIRENQRREAAGDAGAPARHRGESFGAAIPDLV